MDLDIINCPMRGLVVCGYAGSRRKWLKYMPFDKFFEYILESENWAVHLGLMIHFESNCITAGDYIILYANPDQKQRYIEYLRSGINDLHEKIPDLFNTNVVKSARNV